MKQLPFAKGQGLGNDYIVIDRADASFEITSAFARAICDRNRGVGSDGLLVCETAEGGFRLRILNPDGSEAEKSGNGLRILGAYLHGRGLVEDAPFDVALKTDSVEMQVERVREHRVLDIRVEMGRATFHNLEEQLDLGDEISARGCRSSIGNPHYTVFVPQLTRMDFLKRAPRIAAHAAFPNGTNVQFAHVISDNRVEAWIWERGAGETLASGSSACAVAAAAHRTGRVKGKGITIAMPGGEAQINLSDDYDIRLRGPAQIIYTGTISADVLSAWTL